MLFSIHQPQNNKGMRRKVLCLNKTKYILTYVDFNIFQSFTSLKKKKSRKNREKACGRGKSVVILQPQTETTQAALGARENIDNNATGQNRTSRDRVPAIQTETRRIGTKETISVNDYNRKNQGAEHIRPKRQTKRGSFGIPSEVENRKL